MGNTVQDAIIAEILGDVGKLRDEVKRLSAVLPAISANIVRELDKHKEDILAAARTLARDADYIEERINGYTEDSAQAVAQWARKEIGLAAVTAATSAVRDGVATEFGKAGAKFVRDLRLATISVSGSAQQLQKYNSGLSWFLPFLAFCFSVLGGLVVFAAMMVSGFLHQH